MLQDEIERVTSMPQEQSGDMDTAAKEDVGEKLLVTSLRTVINAIKCNTPENGNINILLYGDVAEPTVQVKEESSQNAFISKLINLSNHPSVAVKAAVRHDKHPFLSNTK